ncbi:hypothetical protein BBO99_00008097 [Phytophthora kernoviae]|uniref:Uncharacterized protein n=2 Tax=Phytophthora kernoviae TaxID=325452 RepID=A0A3R7GSD2_9STRA|nr:hypothetical protein G195_008121 [Phytophthora kernoviae 00238/432]KAG2505151.1 hypothetical protein JM16_009291 [Phytophthora kernoviae]KAG2512415.1 hypothetical protein JM18_008560 [Phytophthora kernoviae]RLN45258.1 hypothetical protein BBI17_008014 [Phytophthora kernoviae]RLN75752.1 hypothetical protein BBO99_00008097 [Phytophthora kernoviae]
MAEDAVMDEGLVALREFLGECDVPTLFEEEPQRETIEGGRNERQENYQKERLISRHNDLDEKSNGVAVFKSFLSEMSSLYAQTDPIYQHLEFKVAYSMGYLTRKRDHEVEYFDGTDSTLIPFSFEETADAISLFMLSDSGGIRYEEGITDPDNTTAMKCNLNYRFESGDSAALVSYTVTKRYEEADRLVFIWRALTEGQGDFAGLHTDETGWLVIRPSTEDDDSDSADLPDSPITIMERYVRLFPVCIGGVSRNKVGADRLAKIVIKSDEEEVKEMTEMLDDLLLDSP